MSFNLYTPNLGLQNLATIKSPTHNATSNNQFETKNASSARVSGDDDSFARMMESIKQKAQQQRQNQEKSQAQTTNAAHAHKDASETAAKFKTEKTGIDLISSLLTPVATTKAQADVATTTTTITDNQSQVPEGDVLDIASLADEIAKLIAEQTDENEDSTKTTLSVSLDEIQKAGEDKDGETLLNILSTLLAQAKENEDGEAAPNGMDQSYFEMLSAIQSALNSDTGYKLLSNLTPDELNALDEGITLYIKGELNEEDTAALEDVIAQFIALTPPPQDKKAPVNAPIIAQEDAPKAAQTLIGDKNHAQSRYEGRYDIDARGANTTASQGDDSADFKTAMKDADKAGIDQPKTANDNAKNAAQQSLQSGITQGSTTGIIDPLTSQNGLSVSATTTQPQSVTATTITQSQSAAQPHAATQMVSATIQKAVKEGESTNIKLRLDPPELGRVEVKMSIDKDNVTKIVLTVEKPDTFLLLQKDSDALHRAMTNAGLDMSSDDGLSFELASDNHDFNNPNDNGRNGNKNGKNDNFAEDTAIETTMDWHVDPHTGRMHYNVLA